MKTLNPRVMLLAVWLVVMALTMCVGRAHADDTGQRTLTWTGVAPQGWGGTWAFCDGVLKGKVAAPGMTWTSAVGEFADGTHQCYVQPAANGQLIGGLSNTITFVVTAPAPVVVVPPVPFVLTVE